ncbi:MAG: hypothetical protein ACM3PF_08080 [Bacteroidota bacterium]
MMPSRRILAAPIVACALLLAATAAEVPAQSATGSASVRLVRLLDEIPDSLPPRMGKIHDIRLRLEPGNVLLVKHRGDFIALLPIERHEGNPDSLLYFYYREGAPFLWFFAGARDKFVRTVPDAGEIRFDDARLLWSDGPQLGWIYFPDVAGNEGLRFSVVSGKSVDQVDPRDTKYWVELGTPGTSGF